LTAAGPVEGPPLAASRARRTPETVDRGRSRPSRGLFLL